MMKYEKRLIRALGLLLALFLAVLAAGGGFPGRAMQGAQAEGQTQEDDLIVVGFSQLGSESAWRLTHTQSIQDALSKENGFFLQFDNARQKQENQIKAIRGFISQRVDYIAFSPLMEDGWETVLTEAKEAGIPVILVDRQISGSPDLYTTFIGSDMVEEGRKAGEWLAEHEAEIADADGQLDILVLEGTEGSTSQLGRSQGFSEMAAEHANWHILDERSGDFTVEKGKEAMASMLDAWPAVDVVVSQNDEMTFGAMEAIRERGLSMGIGGDIALISFDGVGDALELVESGQISCDVECNPRQGDLLAEVIRKLEAGEPVERAYYVEEKVFSNN